MGIVIEREFKSLLRSVKASACIALLTLISGLYFLVNNLIAGYPAMHSVFSNMSLAAALIIPAVASGSFTKEKKCGTEAFLYALPVTKAQVVLGKFLGIMAFFMIPTAVMGIYPIILSVLGGDGIAGGYLMLLMFVLIEAFIVALCIMISAFCKKTWKAMVLSYAVMVLTFVIGMLSALVDRPFKGILNFLSPFRRFDPTVFDLFDLSSVLFYLSLTALLLWLTVLKIRAPRKQSNSYKTAKKKNAIVASVLAVIVLAANVGAFLLPGHIRQLDMSNDKLYSVSESTKKYLSSLDDEITVYLIDPKSAEEKLHSYIRRYCAVSDNITLKEIDTAKDTEFLKKYGMTSATLYSMIIESKNTGRWKLVTSEEYFKYRHAELGAMTPSNYYAAKEYYSEMYSYYAQYSSSSEAAKYMETAEKALYAIMYETALCLDAEQSITEAIEYVTAKSVPTMYFASGHGEKNTEANPLNISSLTAMPENATVVIINDPDSDYSTAEIALLQKYSDNGGRLMVITDESIGEKPNLSMLLAGFGLSAEEGTVSVDGNTDVKATVNTAGSIFGSLGFESLNISGGSSIVAAEVGDLAFSKLLTVSIPVSEEETQEKTLGIAVSENNKEKLIWLTGADSFNRDVSKLTNDEKTEYEKAAYCISYAVNWLWTPFESSLEFPTEAVYEPTALIVESGAATTFGVVFIGIIPLAIIGASAITRYARKKRSSAIEIQE